MNEDVTVRTYALEDPSQGVPLSQYASVLLDCQTEEEVVAGIFHLWSSELGRAALFVVDQGDVVGTESRGLEPAMERRLRGARLPIRSHWVLAEVVSAKEFYMGPGSAEVGTTWLTDRLGVPPGCRIIALPIQDPLGEVQSIMVGSHPRAQQTPERLKLLRASIRAAMRYVQAQQALRQLQRYEMLSAG